MLNGSRNNDCENDDSIENSKNKEIAYIFGYRNHTAVNLRCFHCQVQSKRRSVERVFLSRSKIFYVPFITNRSKTVHGYVIKWNKKSAKGSKAKLGNNTQAPALDFQCVVVAVVRPPQKKSYVQNVQRYNINVSGI